MVSVRSMHSKSGAMLIIVLAGFLCVPGLTLKGQKYPWREYTVSDGLPQTQANHHAGRSSTGNFTYGCSMGDSLALLLSRLASDRKEIISYRNGVYTDYTNKYAGFSHLKIVTFIPDRKSGDWVTSEEGLFFNGRICRQRLSRQRYNPR